MNTSQANFSQTGGEDFFTLREYQQGDDLRRVHWPSSAKRDELMIRQLEMPWQSRALVVLDPGSAVPPAPKPSNTRSAGRHRRSATSSRPASARACGAAVGTHHRGVGRGLRDGDGATRNGAGRRRSTWQDGGRMRRTGLTGGALIMVTGTPDESTRRVPHAQT